MWWDRLWIIQEFAVAKNDPVVCFGIWAVPWCDLTDIMVRLVEEQSFGRVDWDAAPDEDSTDFTANALAGLGKLDNIRVQYQEGFTSLCALAVHSSSANASLGKDKVYGLLGLTSERESQAVRVDYTESDGVVFATATYASIAATQSLTCLLLSALFRKNHPGIPSWTIDFDSGIDLTPSQREPLIAYLARKTDPMSTWQHYHTCIHSGDRMLAKTSLSADAELLTVHGSHFDVVPQTMDLPPAVDPDVFATGVIDMLHNITENPYRRLTCRTSPARGAKHLPSCLCGLGQPEHSRIGILPEALEQVNPNRQLGLHDWARTLDVVFKHWIRCVLGDDKAVELQDPVTPARFTAFLPDETQLLVTEAGFLGAAPRGVQCNDRIVLLYGSDWPAILRQQGDGTCLLHGLAFVNGIMDRQLGGPCFDELNEEIFVLR